MPKAGDDKNKSDTGGERRGLLRRVVIFQFKLFVDGLRDVILVPVSIIAALLDLVSGTSGASGNFASVMNLGRRSERYIDLFGEREHRVPDENGEEPALDDLLSLVEGQVRERYRKEGPAGSAQQALDRLRKALKEGRDDA